MQARVELDANHSELHQSSILAAQQGKSQL